MTKYLILFLLLLTPCLAEMRQLTHRGKIIAVVDTDRIVAYAEANDYFYSKHQQTIIHLAPNVYKNAIAAGLKNGNLFRVTHVIMSTKDGSAHESIFFEMTFTEALEQLGDVGKHKEQ